MTQALTNNLNNLQELMTQASQLQNKVAETREVVGVDNKSEKLVDFSKVYEKQVAKEAKSADVSNTTNNFESAISSITKNTSESVSECATDSVTTIGTLGEVKGDTLVLENETNWADFQAILSKITDEVNAESSLDLTLARDIDEIITQLKQAIDETVDETEDVVEKTDVVEEITTPLVQDKKLLDAELLLDEEQSSNENIDAELGDDNTVFQGVLAFVNKEVVNKDYSNDYASKVDNSILNVSENLVEDFSVIDANYETLDMFNNLTADDSANVTKVEESGQDTFDTIIDEEILKELNIESIKADVDASGQEDSLMNTQTPQEQAVKAMLSVETENFDLKLDKTTQIQQSQVQHSKAVDINPSKILEQITRQMEGLQNNSKVNIVLNPEALGRVTVQLIKSGEGLSAQFTVASQEVRDMLMKGLDGLKETLLSHGVGVDNVAVKVNESQKSEYNADWTEQEGSRGGNKEQGRSNREEKEGLFEQMMAQNLEEENGNV